jgi:hypothetical protein
LTAVEPVYQLLDEGVRANRLAYPMDKTLRGWKGCIGTMSKMLKMKV